MKIFMCDDLKGGEREEEREEERKEKKEKKDVRVKDSIDRF